MEKKLLIASILSFLVVYVWSKFTPAPINPSLSVNKVQITDNKNTLNEKKILAGEMSTDSNLTQAKDIINEKKEITRIVSDKLQVEFSNFGGVIEKIKFKEYNANLPIQKILNIKEFESFLFKKSKINENQLVYVFDNEEYRIIRQYLISPDKYTIEANIQIENKGSVPKQKEINVQAYEIDMSTLDNKKMKESRNSLRSRSLLEYVVFSGDKIYRKNNAYKFKDKETKKEKNVVKWVGFRDRYFCGLIKPQYETTGYNINIAGSDQMEIVMNSTKINIPAKNSIDFSYFMYFGPEKLSLLKENNMGFERIKKYYKNALLDGMAKLMNSILHLLHKIFPNWGVCILMMSVIVYFSMYPLTMRGMLSMKKMQSLQPEIVKIKDKYKNDQQKANIEVMDLYKKHKINPLGGCLPMLLQMPVFIGLYQVLWRSVYFNGATFLWIKDLSKPDRLFHLPFAIPFVNSSDFNVLPLLMIAIMFFQQKFSAKNMMATDPAQQSQQKMMGIIMPVFLGFIFYTFASGLTLYFTMFYLFSSFSQWKMSRK